jgi:hypothetical protein
MGPIGPFLIGAILIGAILIGAILIGAILIGAMLSHRAVDCDGISTFYRLNRQAKNWPIGYGV